MESAAGNSRTKSAHIGYSLYSPYYEKCSFEQPITCDLPGASMEVVWLLEKYYGAKFQFVNHRTYGFGAPTETDTIFRGLLNGSIDTAGATMWYISERVTNLPNFSFPLSSEHLGAVLKANSSLITVGASDTLIVAQQGIIWAVLLAFGLFIYFAFHFMEKINHKMLSTSKHVLNLAAFFLSMTVLLYLNFMATTIAVTLFQPPAKHLPFSNFDEMADALLEGEIKLVAMDSATGRFTSPGKEIAEHDETLKKFYEANQIADRVVLVNTVPDAFKHVDEEDRVYVINLLTAQRVPNICDYEVITDETFPTIPFGFFYSNATPAWFKPDGPLMQKTGDVFQHFMKKYVFPNRCVKERPRRGLNLQQTSSMFYLLLVGISIGFVALLWEICHKHTMKRFVWTDQEKSGKEDSLETMKRLAVEYDVKTMVDGIYEESGDLWVCFNRKPMPKASVATIGAIFIQNGHQNNYH